MVFHRFLADTGLTEKVQLLRQILWTIRQEHLEKVSSEVVGVLKSAPSLVMSRKPFTKLFGRRN